MRPPEVAWFAGAFALGFASLAVVDEVPHSARHAWQLLVALALLVAYALASTVLRRSGWLVPGGVAAALAVAVVPAVAGTFLALAGALPSAPPFSAGRGASWAAFAAGAATVAAGVVTYARTRFPFLFFTVTVAAAISAELFLPIVDDRPSTDDRLVTAVVIGCVLVAVGLVLDAAARRREAFWFHAIGFLAVAVALAYWALPFTGDSNRGWVPMIAAGAAVVALAAPLRRATWAVYGVVGFYASVYHWLTGGISASSTGHAVVLLVIGASIFAFGFAYTHHAARREDDPHQSSATL
jgi:hypothetical protein